MCGLVGHMGLLRCEVCATKEASLELFYSFFFRLDSLARLVANSWCGAALCLSLVVLPFGEHFMELQGASLGYLFHHPWKYYDLCFMESMHILSLLQIISA